MDCLCYKVSSRRSSEDSADISVCASPLHHFIVYFRSDYRGIKQLVSVNICSVEGNSAGIFASKLSTGIFVIKVKFNIYYFRRVKTAVLSAIKAKLPFSEGKYQLLNSRNKIPFPTIFYDMNFQLSYPNSSNNFSSHKYPFKKPNNDISKRKTVF